MTAPNENYIDCPLCGSASYEEVYRAEAPWLGVTYANVICKSCGFMFRNPTMNHEAYARLYQDRNNLLSGSQFVNRESGSRSSTLRKERLDFLFGAASLKGGKVLDVGGGDGFLLQGFDSSAWKRVSVDPGERSAVQGDIEFFNSGIEEFEYPGIFDAVLCVSVLEHLRNPRVAIKKISGLLKESGTLLLEVPDSLAPAVKISEFYSFEHICGFTLHTLRLLLSSEGFEIVAVDENMSTANVRVVARKSEAPPPAVQASEYSELLRAVEAYKRKKDAFRARIRGLLSPVINPAAAGRVAVYGAGSHTVELLKIVDFLNSVSCFIDSDSEKQGTIFLGKPVLSPDALPANISLLLISSGDYQDEMYARIEHYERERGVLIIKLYPEHTL